MSTTSIKKTLSKKNILVAKPHAPNRLLTEGATVLISEFKTPANFLDFLTNALQWVDHYSYESRDEKIPGNSYNNKSIFFLTQLIEGVLQPWFAGKNVLDQVAHGLKEILDYSTYEYYHTELSLMLSALGNELKESFFSQEETEKRLQGILTLFKVGFYLEKWEEGEKLKVA